MRRLLPLLLLAPLPLAAQSTLVSVIRQPRATAAEFTVPITELQVKDRGEFAHLHLGVGLGVRHWDDGDNALRFVADAHATATAPFLGLCASVEVPHVVGAYRGPRPRGGCAFHPRWVVSLEGEHLERPFTSGRTPRRRSNVGLVATFRF